jgi:hypothetical protein
MPAVCGLETFPARRGSNGFDKNLQLTIDYGSKQQNEGYREKHL